MKRSFTLVELLVVTVIIGIIVGCISGYFGGKVDLLLMRVTEIFAAIPFLPFAMILSSIMAQSDISENKKIYLLMVILGVLTWTGLARMVRGQVLAARENEYVVAAKAMGVKEFTIAFKHILPNMVTSGNLLCGLFSLILVLHGRYIPAAWLVFFAVIFDGFDGKVARMLGGGSQFGMEFDSLADLVSFGVAPSMLLYHAFLKGWAGVLGPVVACFLMMICPDCSPPRRRLSFCILS